MKLKHSLKTCPATHNLNNFDKLLVWLDQDREKAGNQYESIHYRLTRLFESKGTYISEELADETMDRVMSKIDFLLENYEGEPLRYFFGVAKNVFREFTRKPISFELHEKLSFEDAPNDSLEKFDQLLTESLRTISTDQAQFILAYYQGDTREKIQNRKNLAKKMGVSSATLRVRACRIREHLHKQIIPHIKSEDEMANFTVL